MKSIHTYLHCMGIALSTLIISVPLMHVQAYQLPESTDTELPTLFPAPGEEGLPILPQQTMALPAVTDIVWASILQTTQKDNELAELLNDVPVLLSGILEIQGKDYLYLGIERSYHNTHGSKNIEEILNKKFPGVPIYIEASDGVQTQTAKQEERTTIFSENFENGLTEWTSLAFFSEGWLAHKNKNNTSARAQSCPWGCVLVTKQTINLENYDEVTLTFERWTKNSSLAVQINNETIKQYTGDSTKKTETITIDSRNNARISFVAIGDTAAVDNITITGTRAQEEIYRDYTANCINNNANNRINHHPHCNDHRKHCNNTNTPILPTPFANKRSDNRRNQTLHVNRRNTQPKRINNKDNHHHHTNRHRNDDGTTTMYVSMTPVRNLQPSRCNQHHRNRKHQKTPPSPSQASQQRRRTQNQAHRSLCSSPYKTTAQPL